MAEQIDVSKISAWDLGQIFLQGDGRYDLIDLDDVYEFFVCGALTLEKEEIPNFEIQKEELEDIEGPQRVMKFMAKF